MADEKNYIKHIPQIIEAAAKSPLGVFALMILVLSLLGFGLFRNASELTRIFIFLVMFSGVFLLGVALFRTRSLKEIKLEDQAALGKNEWKNVHPVQTITEALSIPEAYANWVKENCAYMDVDKMRERGEVIQVELPEIFIPLYAHDPSEKKEKVGIGHDMLQREAAEDIENLAAKYA